MKIGILGSAFDPITIGHLWVANAAISKFLLDKIIFVPSSDLRDDKNRSLLNNHHRLNMIKLAIKDEQRFEVNEIEMIREKELQCTNCTMEYFKQLHKDDDFYFIMGADNLLDIPKWDKSEELVGNNKFIVISRDGIDIDNVINSNEILNKNRDNIYTIKKEFDLKISSSIIRTELQSGNNAKDLLPEKCYDYVLKNELYGSSKKGEGNLMRSKQMEIIKMLRVSPSINAKVEIRRRIEFLKAYMRKNPRIESLVLGLSGGQDSTLVGKLSQMAVDELNQELGVDKYKFIGVRLPYGIQMDEDDCRLAIDFIKPDIVITVNIKPAVDTSVKSLNEAGIELSDYLKGNEKARERMKVQYSIAGHYCGLVVGTDHASEAVMGFFTKYGDGASDILPISDLIKEQGTELLIELNAPERSYLKTPTADLEDEKPGLPDEVAFGVTFKEIGTYLKGGKISEESSMKIENAYDSTEHKRRGPITIFDIF